MPYLCSSYPENNLFTLRKTNTYWRFGAVACEGHRFFLFLYPSTPLLAIKHSTIDNQAHRYRQSSTQPLTPKNSAIDNQQLTCPRFFKPLGKLAQLCRANFPDASGSHPHSFGYPSPTPRAAIPFVSGNRPLRLGRAPPSSVSSFIIYDADPGQPNIGIGLRLRRNWFHAKLRYDLTQNGRVSSTKQPLSYHKILKNCALFVVFKHKKTNKRQFSGN